MRFFVTGNRGFIGVHLVDLLKQRGWEVTGCDLGLYDGCHWEPFVEPDCQLRQDVRDISAEDLAGHDVVCHLAAISNDPMGDLDAGLTLSINRDASIELARTAKQAGVDRFLFSGSCSVYGQGAKLDLEEDDPLHPLTTYAQSKIETEQQLMAMADDCFCPVFLRNATAYGHSPMLRIDLVVNNLLASAMAYGEIRIMSDGTPWRPLTHCRDIAGAFVAFAEAPRERVHGQAVNIGGNAENYQVKDVADIVRELIPSARIEYTGEVGQDPRNYRVRFDKLNQLLPDFELEYDLVRGMRELHAKYEQHHFTSADFEGPQFVRLRTLKPRMQMLQLRHTVKKANDGVALPANYPNREGLIVRFEKTPLEGVYLISLEERGDERGFFARAFCRREFAEWQLATEFVQINDSLSAEQGTLRGLHFQLPPHAETKLVRCIRGALWDCVLDLRPASPTFGKWFGTEISAENRKTLYVPKGCAHGFITMVDNTEAFYLVDAYYAPDAERGVRWDDPYFGIEWPRQPAVISDKDLGHADFVPELVAAFDEATL